jgi:hypothetical protein
MTRRIFRAVAVLVQYALVGILFLAIVVFWAIVTQENGSRNLDGVKVTWEELAAQSAQSNGGGGK